MKKLILAIFLFSSPFLALSQSERHLTLKGNVIDCDSVPIPYASIGLLKDKSVGTFSNSAGEFELHVRESHVNDTLLISCIGYENLNYPISIGKNDTIVLTLTTKVYNLKEITISYDTVVNIVRMAARRLRDNLSNEKNILQGFYREVIRSDHTYDRLIEAAVDVFDKGYSSGKELQFKIQEIRKSEDYRDLDWLASIFQYIEPTNGLHGSREVSLFAHDYIRNNGELFIGILNAPLNESFFFSANFTIDSVTYHDNHEVLCIGIYEKDSQYPIPLGAIYLRSKDYAILQMDYTIRVEEKLKSLNVPGENYLSKTIIKYKEYNGKMYLSFLYRKAFRWQSNFTKSRKSQGREGHFFDEKIFIVNEIITEKDKLKRFRKKEKQDKDIDLYSEEWQYNEPFWSTYNLLLEAPLSPNIKKDLVRDDSLDTQFRKTGNSND